MVLVPPAAAAYPASAVSAVAPVLSEPASSHTCLTVKGPALLAAADRKAVTA